MSESRTVHVYGSRADAVRSRIERRAPNRRVVAWRERAALAAGLSQVRVLFSPYPPREGWADARQLELIQICGVGVDHFLPSPDLPSDVEVAGMRGAMAEDVAEHVWLMLLALTRDLPGFLESARDRTFRQRMVPRVRGCRMGLVGFGAIGQAIARRADAFGVVVRAVRRHASKPTDTPIGVEAVLGPEGLDDVLAWCDALVLAVPRTPETRGLLDAGALARLRDGALLINVARGGIVDEEALQARLQAGTLHAALDVFDQEPLAPENPLWRLPNTIVTPHIAGYGAGYLDRAIDLLLDNVDRLERGVPRVGLADRRLGY